MSNSGLPEEIERLAHSIGVKQAKLKYLDERVKVIKGKIEVKYMAALSKLNIRSKKYNNQKARLNLIREKRLKLIDIYAKNTKTNLTNKIAELKQKLIEETKKELNKITNSTRSNTTINTIKKNVKKLDPRKFSKTKKTLIATMIAGLIATAYNITRKAEKKRNEELRKSR